MSGQARDDRRRVAGASSPAAGQTAPASTTRNNEYFIPRDGIDREVITADICRYLGNDALVRPGTYESNGQPIQGYYITAYRNLTSAMIETLKEDSRKWEAERRKGNASGGQLRYADSEYRDREIRNSGGNAAQGQYPPYPNHEYDEGYRPGGQGYPQYPPGHSGYPNGPGGYGAHQDYQGRMDAYAPPPGQNPQYASQYNHPYGQQANGPYMGSVNNAASYHPRQASQPYPGEHSGYGQQPPNPAAYPPQTPSYAGPHAASAAAAPNYDPVQPRDALFGRGGYPNTTSPTNISSDYTASPAGTAGFTPGPGPQQYGEPLSRNSATSSATTGVSSQTETGSSSGPTPAARRDADRHGGERRAHYSSANPGRR